MEIVKIIPESDYAALKQITDEYLPGTKLTDFEKMYKQFPSAVVGYYIGDKMIGYATALKLIKKISC